MITMRVTQDDVASARAAWDALWLNPTNRLTPLEQDAFDTYNAVVDAFCGLPKEAFDAGEYPVDTIEDEVLDQNITNADRDTVVVATEWIDRQRIRKVGDAVHEWFSMTHEIIQNGMVADDNDVLAIFDGLTDVKHERTSIEDQRTEMILEFNDGREHYFVTIERMV